MIFIIIFKFKCFNGCSFIIIFILPSVVSHLVCIFYFFTPTTINIVSQVALLSLIGQSVIREMHVNCSQGPFEERNSRLESSAELSLELCCYLTLIPLNRYKNSNYSKDIF